MMTPSGIVFLYLEQYASRISFVEW